MRAFMADGRLLGVSRNRILNARVSILSIVAGALFAFMLSAAGAQSNELGTLPVPPPDPGYGLYYHDSQSAPAAANRWGYHDGWSEGRRDRNHGDSFTPEEKDHYQDPPEHGGHPGMTREQYVKQYRTAYTHGYKHGSRI